MKRAALFLLLVSAAVACATSRPADPPAAGPAHVWSPIGLAEIADPAIREAATDLLKLVDSDFLWPDFSLNDHGVVIVAADRAYYIGGVEPAVRGGNGTSRVWRRAPPVIVPSGQFRFVSAAEWGLPGANDVVAIGFESRERTVVTAVHEDFHLHYESRHELAGNGGGESRATRQQLETSYSRSEPVRGELRDECAALAAALRSGPGDRVAAFDALQRFTTMRDRRRARPDAPVFEEDFWERQEGIPTNLERRAAARLQFADRSAIGAALTPDGCDSVTSGAYFLVLGGLQSAVLDAFHHPEAWPRLVYPRDGAAASSLYLVIRTLFRQSEER